MAHPIKVRGLHVIILLFERMGCAVLRNIIH